MTCPSYIDEFIGYIASERGLAENTQEAYRRDLEAAFEHCEKAGLAWPMGYAGVVAYIKVLQQKGLKETSQVRALISIKMFLKFLHRESIVSVNEGALLECPKIWQTIPSILSHEQVERLMQLPDLRTDDGIRDRAILEVLYGTGIRVSELCQLTIYDVTDDMIRVFGKGRKERLVPVGKEALKSIDQYLHAVRSKFESEKVRHLFVSSRGSTINRIAVWKIVRYYAKLAGIEKKISPHTFRHTYATHLLDAGADVRVIQELLGHSHISSTDRYTHVSTSHIREAFRAFHPRWK
jgi:integrase/recombinase XerD